MPDNRRRNRLPGGPVPNDGGLALIGDSGRHDLAWRDARLLQQPASRSHLRAPDLRRILLDPPWMRVAAGDRARFHRDDAACFVVQDSASAGGSLVEGEDEGHGSYYKEAWIVIFHLR